MKQFRITFNGSSYKVNYITESTEALKVIYTLQKREQTSFGIDIETAKRRNKEYEPQAGLYPPYSTISTVQIYDGQDSVFVFDAFSSDILTHLRHLKDKIFVAHYGVFEIKHLCSYHGLDLRIGCSMLMSILVDRAEKTDFKDKQIDEDVFDEDEIEDKPHWQGYGLDAVIGRLFDVRIDKKFQTADWSVRPVPQDQLVYAALDAVLTFQVAKVQAKKLAEYKMMKHYKMLCDMQYLIADMELEGFPIDKGAHTELIAKWVDEEAAIKKACKKYFGEVNLNSTLQLHEHFLGKMLKQLGYSINDLDLTEARNALTDLETYRKWKKTKKGQLSFNKTALSFLQHRPDIRALTESRRIGKLISTYGESLHDMIYPDGRIRSSFTIGETRTGRASSRAPNLQNLPRDKDVRNIFRAPPGWKMIVADFNQIELRVAGIVSGDKVILNAYANGEDLHGNFACKIYRTKKYTDLQRQIAKSANFGTIYGMGAEKFIVYCLTATKGEVKLSLQEAQHIIDTLWGTYTDYAKWCRHIRETAEAQGFVRTPLGKMRRLHPKECYTKAPNTVIQGGAFEVMSTGGVHIRSNMDRTLNFMVNNIHDEYILLAKDVGSNVSDTCKIVEAGMNYGMTYVFPKANTFGLAKAHVCDRWGDGK